MAYAHTDDGVKLYYEKHGRGEPTIVCCNGIGVSTFFWKYIIQHFSRQGSVIVWDYRGHGRSSYPPDLNNLTMERNARDVAAVMDAAGVKKAVLIGHSMGTQVIYEFYRLFPQRTLALVPVLGTYKHPADTFFNTSLSKYVLFFVADFAEKHPRITRKVWDFMFTPWLGFHAARLFIIHPTLCSFEDMKPYFYHLRELKMEVFFNMARKMQEHSAEKVLPKIKVPTLIIGGEKDVFTPSYLSYEMNRLIPNSRLLMIKQGSHAALVEQPDLINCELDRFLRENGILPPLGKKARPVRKKKTQKKPS